MVKSWEQIEHRSRYGGNYMNENAHFYTQRTNYFPSHPEQLSLSINIFWLSIISNYQDFLGFFHERHLSIRLLVEK